MTFNCVLHREPNQCFCWKSLAIAKSDIKHFYNLNTKRISHAIKEFENHSTQLEMRNLILLFSLLWSVTMCICGSWSTSIDVSPEMGPAAASPRD